MPTMSVTGMRAKRAAREALPVTRGVADMRARYTALAIGDAAGRLSGAFTDSILRCARTTYLKAKLESSVPGARTKRSTFFKADIFA